jgi:O-antigen ligase
VPEYLKALIVILGLSVPVFWIARLQVCDDAINQKDFDRRRNLWYGLTAAAFLANHFWLYAAMSCVMIWYGARKEKNSIALFLFVAFAVPPIALTIPGLGGIQQVFSVSHTRMLALFLLAPAYFKLRGETDTVPFGKVLTDKFLLAYIILPLILQINVDTLTNTVRFGLYAIVDVFLPYYVASRGMKRILAWRDAAMSFMVSVAILATIAIFEYSRKWPLYGSVSSQLGVDTDLGGFMLRGENLRAIASTGHSLVLGYLLVIGFAFFASSKNLVKSRRYQATFGLVILLALLATAARGAWIATLTVILVLLFSGKTILRRIILLGIGIVVAIGILTTTDRGSELLDYLPFVGTSNSESIIYRQKLIDVSIQIVKLNPMFGSFDYMRNPLMQQMLQGEGIIDIVNTYVGIALTYGVIGLAIFVGVFASCGWSVWRAMRLTVKGGELNNAGRSLLAALTGILISIATCSSVTYVALFYWIVAGLCVGYAQMVDMNQEQSAEGLMNNVNQALPQQRFRPA